MGRDRDAEYRAIDALNWSSLKLLEESGKLFLYRKANPEPSKPSYIFGRAVHCLAFEPDQFDARFAVFDGRRDPRTAKWKAWQSDHPGMDALKPDEVTSAHEMVEALKQHREAGPLLESCRVEEPCLWTEPRFGFECKGKFDGINSSRIVDLKTSVGFLPRDFANQCARFLYHGQIAWYTDGARQAKLIDGSKPPVIIAQSKDAPYDVAVYLIDDYVLEAGRKLYNRLLVRLKVCMETGEWPGAVPEAQPLMLPPWAPGCENPDSDIF